MLTSSSIAIIGEAWGADEEKVRAPFVGKSGQELTNLLSTAGINRSSCFLTNVFNARPKNNQIEEFFCPKKEGCADLPPLRPGKYLRPEYRHHLDRLYDELKAVQPTVIIACGATPCWALLRTATVTKIRGYVHSSPWGKVLPTFHPAYVLRMYQVRSTVIADLMKAKEESTFPEVRRPERHIWIEPTIEDLHQFKSEHIASCDLLTFDIETRGRQITCIGYSPSQTLALVIPFVIDTGDGSYWTVDDERRAWNFVRSIQGSHIPKLAQNGLYDIQYLWESYGIPTYNYLHDTMLLHHSLQPELPKGLGFLASVHTNEAAWKDMRKKGYTEYKRDE